MYLCCVNLDILRRYRFTYRNTLRHCPGIWIVKGNTTQTIHRYPYHNIQYITETAYIYIYIYTYISAPKIFMHWHRPGFQWEASVHFYAYHSAMPRGDFCSKTSSLPTVNRPFCAHFSVPPVIHQRFADIHKRNPRRSMRIPINTHVASMLLHPYNGIIPGSHPLARIGSSPVLDKAETQCHYSMRFIVLVSAITSG